MHPPRPCHSAACPALASHACPTPARRETREHRKQNFSLTPQHAAIQAGALPLRGVLESWTGRAGLLRPYRVGRAQLSPGWRSPRRHGPPRPRLVTSDPCSERRGIAGGSTPHLVLSSTLEPLSALSECSRPAQGPVLRAQPVYCSARVAPARPATCIYQKQNSHAPELTPSPPLTLAQGSTLGA